MCTCYLLCILKTALGRKLLKCVCDCACLCMLLRVWLGMGVCACRVSVCVRFHLLHLCGRQTCSRPYISIRVHAYVCAYGNATLFQNSLLQPAAGSLRPSEHGTAAHLCPSQRASPVLHTTLYFTLSLSFVFLHIQCFVGGATYLRRKHIHNNCRFRMSAPYCVLPDGGRALTGLLCRKISWVAWVAWVVTML